MSKADEMAEIEAIKTLKARYFRHMDTKNWPEWRKVFTDDFVMRVDVKVGGGEQGSGPPLPEGADALVRQISVHMADMTTVHHGHMPEITLESADTATGVWAMEDIVSRSDGRVRRGFGHYHEDYRKQDGDWRIARMHLTRLRLEYAGPWPASEDGTAGVMDKGPGG